MVKQGIYTLALMVAAWWCISEGAAQGWGVGFVTIVLAAAASLSIRSKTAWRLSLAGLVRFVPFFLWQSLRGSLDVARRAFHPSRPLDPTFMSYPLRLSPGYPQICFANVVSLLPGTLSARILGNELTIHALDEGQPIAEELRHLEVRVGEMFGERLEVESGHD